MALDTMPTAMSAAIENTDIGFVISRIAARLSGFQLSLSHRQCQNPLRGAGCLLLGLSRLF